MYDFCMSNQGLECTVAKFTILIGAFVELGMNVLITEKMFYNI